MATTIIFQLLSLLAALMVPCIRAEPAAMAVETGSDDAETYLDDPEPPMSEQLINTMTEAPDLYEGDIILDPDLRETIEGLGMQEGERARRAITLSESRRWPDGKVPYVISSSLGSKARSAIEAAMRDYAAQTCIQLYPRGSERDYLYFYKDRGCFSSVGRVGGGQRISIGVGCEYKGIVMHEIFHALGRWHEQSRPDRDAYVTIKYDNIKDGVETNFMRLGSELVKTQGVQYDYHSVMHYSGYAFSRNGRPTIEPKDRSVRSSSLGQRVGLSSRDIQHVLTLYCTAEEASWGTWGSWTSCSRTCNGGIRSRQRSCEGGTTCIGSNIEEQTCNSQVCQVAAQWSAWSSWSGCSASCGGGRQAKSRRCLNGNTCAGKTVEYRSCNTQACQVAQGTWSLWSSWSSCSASCGGATQTRARQCLSEPCEGPTSQQRTCNSQQCPRESAGLRHEGCYRVLSGNGLFLLESRTSELKDNPFQRTEPVPKCARAATQNSFSIIGVSAGYCISGNERLSDFTKVASNLCKDGRGAYGRGLFHMDVYTVTDRSVFRDDAQPQSDDANGQESTPTSGTSDFRTSTFTFFIITTLIILFI